MTAARTVVTLALLALALLSAGSGVANAVPASSSSSAEARLPVLVDGFADTGGITIVVLPAGGAGIPTGIVMVATSTSYGTFTGSLDQGMVRFTANQGLLPGKYDLQVSYLGDSNFASSGVVPISVTVGASSSSSSVSPPPLPLSPSVSANAASGAIANTTFDISVGVTGSGPVPTGKVSLSIDGHTVDANSFDLDGKGNATIPVAFPAGQYSGTVSYAGDANYAPGTAAVAFTVNAGTSTIAPKLSVAKPQAFEALTLYAAVVGDAGTPTGSVTFTIEKDGQPYDSQEVSLNAGIASLAEGEGLPAGNYAVTLTYAGDGTYKGTRTTFGFDVAGSGSSSVSSSSSSMERYYTKMRIGADPASPAEGEAFVVIAGLPPGATGTVGFSLSSGGTTYVSSEQAVTSGAAQLSLGKGLPAGTYQLDVSYGGDGTYQPATQSIEIVVNAAASSSSSSSPSSEEHPGPDPQGQYIATQISLDADPAKSVEGQTVTFTAHVAADEGTPNSGDVVFKVDGVGTVVVSVHGGIATYATGTLTLGSHEVTAAYTGDDEVYGPSTPASVTVSVGAKAVSPPIVSNTLTLWTTQLLDIFGGPPPTPGGLPAADAGTPDLTNFAPTLSPDGGHISASLSAINAAAGNQKAAAFDAWLDGTFGVLQKGSTSGSYANGRAGVSYNLNPSLLAGVMVSVDRIATSDGAAKMTGIGWLLGPYISAKLGDSVSLTLGAGGGLTQNTISPDGTYSDTVGGSQFVLSGRLGGHWSIDDWTFSPAMTVAYAQEHIDPYTDGLGNAVTAVTAGSGKIGVAPEISHSFRLENGAVVIVGARFETALKVEFDGVTWTYAGLQDAVGSDVSLVLPGGATVTASGTMGGLLFGDVKSARGTVGINAALP